MIERDNRGVGAENPINADPVASDVAVKRVYQIDVSGATDVSRTTLRGLSSLPVNVTPVSKSLVFDIHDSLSAAGLRTPEKIEGMTIGPQLSDGSYALLLATDNDSSVMLTDGGDLFDVYTDGSLGPVDGEPLGRALLPSQIFSFQIELPDYLSPSANGRPLLPGDADQDYDFDQLDLVQVQQAGKYLSGDAATWGEGDWNGAPGGAAGSPPPGDGLFNQLDIVAALSAGAYLTGSYRAMTPSDSSRGDDIVEAERAGNFETILADRAIRDVFVGHISKDRQDVTLVLGKQSRSLVFTSRSDSWDGGTPAVIAVPEPGSAWLFLSGIVALCGLSGHLVTTGRGRLEVRSLRIESRWKYENGVGQAENCGKGERDRI